MRRVLLLLCVGPLLASIAGCGSKSDGRSLALKIELKTSAARPGPLVHVRRTFTLACDPPAGTLPFAARICADIRRHPEAMLRPADARSFCVGGPFMPDLAVFVVEDGRRTAFEGSPFCTWPGGTTLGVYWAAIRRDTHLLDAIEPRLRCDEDPALLVRPTPWRNVAPCLHGLWTPRIERLVALAKQRVHGAGFDAALFPDDVGMRSCGEAVELGLPAHSECAVYIRNALTAWPRVTFVETSMRRTGQIERREWHANLGTGQPPRVPGEPQGTPAWLRERIWNVARSLHDPHPSKIVITLNLHERGRVVDRVWMRGHFVCDSCGGLSGRAAHGRLAGFTVDAKTRDSLSFSLHGG